MKQINNRGEWYARDWVIAMLFFSGGMVLLYLISTDVIVSYGESSKLDPSFLSRYDRFQNTSNQIQTMYDNTAGTGLNLVIITEVFSKSSLTVVALVLGSIGIFNSQIVNISRDLGIPSVIAYIIGPLIIGVVTVTLIFIIITAISGRNKI